MTDTHDKYISLINIGGNGHYVKDAEARAAITAAEGRITTNESDISTLKAAVKDGAHFLGKIDTAEGKTTALTDGCTTTPVYIIGTEAPVAPKSGDFVVQANSTTTVEFIWDGAAWRELGSTATLKAFAFVDKGEFTYTPAGGVTVNSTTTETDTVTNPIFTGDAATLTGSFTGTTDQAVSVKGTPTGTVSTPTISVELATTTFKNLTATMGTTEADAETLTLTTPDVTYATGTVSKAESTQPTFTGNELTSGGTFTAAGTIAMDSYTPTGTNTGTAVTIKAHTHGASFAGTEATVEVSPKA